MAKQRRQYTADPPWIQFDKDLGIKVSYSFRAQRSAQRKEKSDDIVQRALHWSTQQAYASNDQAAEDMGLGNWVIINCDIATKLRQRGHLNLVHGANTGRTSNNWDLVTKLTFVQLDRSPSGAQERLIGIQQGLYLDLPVLSVRVIRAKIMNLTRALHFKRFDLKSKYAERTVSRITKLLSCGMHADTEKQNDLTGEVLIRRDLTACRVKGCGQPDCVLARYHERKTRYKRNIDAIFSAAQQQNLKPVYITIVTNWELPTSEHRQAPPWVLPGKRSLWISGTAPTPEQTRAPDLLTQRLTAHKDSLSRFCCSKQLTKHVVKIPHRVTEVSWLPSRLSGRRFYPNPHTHAVALVTKNKDLKTLARELTKLYRQFASPDSTVFVQEARDSESLARYDSKEHAITDDLDDVPTGTEVPAVLDDRSLMEQQSLDDHSDLKLYRSDLQLTHLLSEKQRRVSCLTLRLPPRKVIGNKLTKRKLVFVFVEKDNATRRFRRTRLALVEYTGADEPPRLSEPALIRSISRVGGSRFLS